MKLNLLNNNFSLLNILILCVIFICMYMFIYFKTNRDLLDDNRVILLDNHTEITKIWDHEKLENNIISNQLKIIDILKINIDSIYENQKIIIDAQKNILFNQKQILFNQRQILFNQTIKKNN